MSDTESPGSQQELSDGPQDPVGTPDRQDTTGDPGDGDGDGTVEPGPEGDGGTAPCGAGEDPADEGAAGEGGRGGVRRTRRTIHRRTTVEDIVESVVEDLPAGYALPFSDYPVTVG